MGLPPDQAMRQGIPGANLAFSPDGSRLVYVGPGEGGDQLWVRDRDRLDATPLPGTLGAVSPWFSPDGQRIVFSAGANFDLKIVPVTGGPPITLTTPGSGAGGGMAWGPDGWIYFDAPPGLSRIRADGGTPEPVVPLDSAGERARTCLAGGTPERQGAPLPFPAQPRPDRLRHRGVRLQDARTPRPDEGPAGTVCRAGIPGLCAGRRGRPRGAVRPGQVRADGARRAALRRGDDEGVRRRRLRDLEQRLAGLRAGAGLEHRWGRRTGVRQPAGWRHSARPAGVLQSLEQSRLSLSPDGTRIALDVVGVASPDIWIKQLPSGPLSRLTFDGTSSVRPTWTADGQTVLYLSTVDSGPMSVWKKRADGSAAAELVWRAPMGSSPRPPCRRTASG